MKLLTFIFSFLGLSVFAFCAYAFLLSVPTAVKDWDRLCEVEDCSQLPDLHMTYEVDGTRYYFPSSTDPERRGNFFGVLPMGVNASRSAFRYEHPTREVYVNWRVLDFDMYLETRADDTIRRGFARLNAETETMRFGNGTLRTLPAYFGVEGKHPFGPLTDFAFYLHSKNSTLSEFHLNALLAEHQRYHQLRGTLAESDQLARQSWVVSSRADLADAGFRSFNETFWIVSEDYGSHFINNHIAVVSKVPLLHGRHVYGVCRSQCWFYSLVFPDDPENDEPLLAFKLGAEDRFSLRRDTCTVATTLKACDPARYNVENIRARFAVVEDVVEALREHPG